MDIRDDQDAIQYGTEFAPQAAPVGTVTRRGVTPSIAAAVAAACLATGVGVGYLAFHDSTKATPKAKPAAAPAAGPTFVLTGSVSIGSNLQWSSETDLCEGQGGYDDITSGASVVVTDQSGTTIATGELQQGQPIGVVGERAAGCRFAFTVAGVPADKTFYGVAVTHRGTVTYSADQAKGGQVALSLG